MPASRDVVIIGGGHNGLVAAAYLARAGLSTLVCERREIVGGAAVSEHPFGPDYTVTSLSYVVSLLPPRLVHDLRLDRHGYHVYPQGPYFAPRAMAGTCACRPTMVSGTRRSPSSPRATRTHTTVTRRGLRGSGRYSDRCSARFRPSSGPGDLATCSARACCCGTCARSTPGWRSTSPG